MLKIVTGRIASGKTHKILDEIGQRIKNKQKTILIVPDPVTYNFEQRLCEQLNINGFIDVEVCSFNRFATSVLNFFGKNKKTYLDDCAKAMAVRACVLRCEENLTVFKSAVRRKGFCARCLNMISTLENCGYTFEDIINVSQKLPDSILKYKLNDMALIFKEYTAILKKGYTDNADKLLTAQNLLKYYPPLKDAVVYIDGFDVFTSHLYNFIEKLTESANVVITVSSSMDFSDKPAYEIHQDTFNKIISIAKKINVEYKVIETKRTFEYKAPEIHFLEDNFYAQRAKIYEGDCKNIVLSTYHNTEDEVNSVAKKILSSVKSGARFKDFAVLSNDVLKYSPIISAVFKRYNIPVYTDKKHDICSHPASTYLFSVLKCAFGGFTPENVCAIALTSLTSLTSDERDKFISTIKELGVKSWELENGLVLKRGKDEDQAQFDILRKKFIEPLKIFREDILKCSTARQMASVCYKFLETQGIYDKIQNLVDSYEKLEFFELSDVTAQLWNKLQELLESISDLFEDNKITLSEFSETLYEGFKAMPLSTIPSVLDSVTFGDLSASKEQNLPYTFIIGANDGVIPAVYTDEKLVTQAESNILLDYGMELAHSEETEDARIRYKIYCALCSPLKKLEFSCPAYTDGGSPLRASHIFKRLEAIFPKIKWNFYNKTSVLEQLNAPVSRGQAMLDMAKDKFNSPQSKALLEILSKSPDRKLEILKKEAQEKEISIPKDLAISLFSPNKATSISRLETFATCPYKHFIEYGISPRNIEDYSANALDIGTMIHSTLEIFTKENANKDLSRKDCYEKTSEIFEKILPQVHFGAMLSSERQKAFNSILKNLACEGAWQIKEHIKNFTVIGEEISFGTSKYPPIEIETEYGTLYIKGKIDRADKLEKHGNVYLRIIDYKSGKKSFSQKSVEDGTDLQLAIYMSALLSKFENSVPAAAQYMRITENTFSGPELIDFNEKGISEDAFNNILTTAMDKAQNLTKDMLQGNIQATKTTSCQYCQFSAVCGIKHIKEGNKDANLD